MSDKIHGMTLEELITKYYTNYYKIQLGLPDWQPRVENRMSEESIYCLLFINWIEEWFEYDFTGKKVLVVGCGTGGELVNFHRKGAEVFGIDPNEDAITICNKKAEINDIPQKNIIKAVSENIPFNNDEFDFVYCSTVLVHVNNVRESISEMIRCTKPKSRIFIETPDYRQWYEPHYKLYLPMFLPKWFNKLLLILLGRPVNSLDSIQYVNSKMLTNIFMDYPVTLFKVIHSWPASWKKPGDWRMGIVKFIFQKFEIQKNQFWILQKLIKER